MAVGYLSRAARRTAMPAAETAPSIRSVAPIASPLVEEDQRLNLGGDLGGPPVQEYPAPAPPAHMRGTDSDPGAWPTPEGPAREGPAPADPATQTADEIRPPHTRESEPHAEVPDPPERSGDRPAHVGINDVVADTNASETAGSPPHAPRTGAEEWPAIEERGKRPLAEAPAETRVLTALAMAEKWVSGDTGPEEIDPSARMAAPAGPPRRDTRIEPVLPANIDPDPVYEPPPSLVQIGTIEVEIVPPPAPAAAPPRPRSAPVKPRPGPAMPYGWRQR